MYYMAIVPLITLVYVSGYLVGKRRGAEATAAKVRATLSKTTNALVASASMSKRQAIRISELEGCPQSLKDHVTGARSII